MHRIYLIAVVALCAPMGPGCGGGSPLETDAGLDAHVLPSDGGAIDASAPDDAAPPDGEAAPDVGPALVDSGAAGCGWSSDGPGFVCGSSAMPPDGAPNVACEGTTCTYTDPDATCFIQSCDYATGTIVTCTYSAGDCPCDTPVVCE